MISKIILRKTGLTLLAFMVLSIVLYFPTITRSFVSDDFSVIRRVALDRMLLIKGFFRPLSDLTLYINYLIGGFNPAGYNLFGILLHGINSFLLFSFCKKWKWTSDNSSQDKYALFAATLFLCYPFHNEGVVWVLGRGSSMAGTFGMLSLILLVGKLPESIKIFSVCLCFFIGLTAYESIIVLPVMIFVILYKDKTKWRCYVRWILALSVTFILHLFVRIKISGVLAGKYGEDFFSASLQHYLANLFKTAGRLFLPPVQNSSVFSGMLSFLAVLLIAVSILVWRKTVGKDYFLKIICLIFIAAIVPVLSSVSTKTSESDRFLYFPSFFVCCFISFILINLISKRKELLVTASLVCSCFIFFLEKNNANWIRASDYVKNIITTIKENKSYNNIFIVNLPDEIDGAYIFRIGFLDALLINQIDTSGIIVVNQLRRDQMISRGGLVTPEIRNGGVNIFPQVTVREGNNLPVIQKGNDGEIYLYPGKESKVLYWNSQQLKKLQ